MRNITHEHTRAKSISGRYPTLYVSLTIHLNYMETRCTGERTNQRCLARTSAVCVRQQGDWKLGKTQGDGALTWKNQWHVSPMMGNPMEPLGMGSLQLLSRVAVHLSCQSCWDTARRSAMDTKHAASVASAETRSKLSKSMAVNVRGLFSKTSLEWWALQWLSLLRSRLYEWLAVLDMICCYNYSEKQK